MRAKDESNAISKVVYIGNVAQAAEFILYNADMQLLAVICEENRVSEDMITFCLIRNIALKTVSNKSQLVTAIEENCKCDFFVMYAFGIILPKLITERFEIFNIHLGYLPDYKGRHPTYWATVKNEKFIGMSLHRVTADIDSGAILERLTIPYYFWMSENELEKSIIEQIPKLLCSLSVYKRNGSMPIGDSNSAGGYFLPVSDEDKTICLDTDSFDVIFNKIRAQSKYDGAKVPLDHTTIWIKQARFVYRNIPETGDYFEENGFLYLYIRNDTWLKSNDYKFEENVSS